MEQALTCGELHFGDLHFVICQVLVSGIQWQNRSSAQFPGPRIFTLFCIDINIPCVPLEM